MALLLVLTLVLQAAPLRDTVPANRVRGRVLDSLTGAAIAGALVTVVPAGGSAAPHYVEATTNGEFELHDVPRGARLAVNPPAMQATHVPRLIQLEPSASDISDMPVEFGAEPAGGVEIVLSQRTAELSGRVLDGLGRPTEEAGVLYFPADPARWKAYEGGLRQRSVGGRYRIDRIPGGDYFVIAVSGPRPGWTEKDYAALAPLAERVTLYEGEQRVLDLRVVTLGR